MPLLHYLLCLQKNWCSPTNYLINLTYQNQNKNIYQRINYAKNYVIGFPRIGEKRELKKVLENYWSKQTDFNEVKYVAEQLKRRHWNYQKDAKINFIASNDFSYYDNMLDTTILLGAIPQRFQNLKDEELHIS